MTKIKSKGLFSPVSGNLHPWTSKA